MLAEVLVVAAAGDLCAVREEQSMLAMYVINPCPLAEALSLNTHLHAFQWKGGCP